MPELFTSQIPSPEATHPDLRHFQEALQHQPVNFHLQVILKTGEQLAGHLGEKQTGNEGYNLIYSSPMIQDYLEASLEKSIYWWFNDARQGLPTQYHRFDSESLTAVLVHLPTGAPAETILALDYLDQRPDNSSRKGLCTVMLFLPASLTAEAIKILSVSPQAGLGIILDKIDPKFRQISPINNKISYFSSVERTYVPVASQAEKPKKRWPFGK